MPGTNPELTCSGQFVVINDTGLLILGDSGSGKSDVCLDLIRQGHRLVADDAVRLYTVDGRLTGSPTPATRKQLSIRGLGILDVCALFGETVFCAQHNVDLAVELYRPSGQWPSLTAMELDKSVKKFLQVSIFCYRLPMSPSRHLSTLLETLVQLHNHCKAPLD